MKVALIPVGNSKGVRIPASIIKACNLGDTLDMRVENGTIVLEAERSTRAGWSEAFARMAATGDDAPLLPENAGNEFDDMEWTW